MMSIHFPKSRYLGGECQRRVVGDYFTLQRGTTYKSRLLGQPGPVLLGLASIQPNGGFRTDSLRTYGGDSPDKLLVQPGGLYLSLKDVTQSANLLGAVARLPIDHPPGRLTQDTVKLEPIGSNVPLDYLYWLLRTPQYREYCRAHATGTTNLGMARDDFLAFPAPEPTQFQQQIINTLCAIEEKIESNRRVIITLEAMARALFKSWFVDFDPVRTKAEGRNIGIPKAIADLFPTAFQESELGRIPDSWNICKWGDLATLEYGRGLQYYDNPNGAYCVYGTNGAIGTTTTPLCQHPTVVIGRKGAYRGVHFSEEPCHVIDTAFYLEPIREFEMRWAYYQLLSVDINAMDSGSAIPSTSREDFYALPVLYPPPAIQHLFISILDPVWSAEKINNDQCRTITAVRDNLLPKLVSGEIRIDVPKVTA